MSLNQVLRYVGFAIGSALDRHRAGGGDAGRAAADPTSGGYTVIAVVGLVTCLVMAVITWLLPSRSATPAS